MKYQLTFKTLRWPLIVGGVVWAVSRNFSMGVAGFAIALMPVMVGLYIPYAKDNPKHLWFKRKLYGWGWTPVTWQGWAVTFIYVGLVMAFALTIDEHSPMNEVLFTFILPTVLLTGAFIRIAILKGEKPQWQWGRK